MDRQTLHAAVTAAPGIRTGLVEVDQLLRHTCLLYTSRCV